MESVNCMINSKNYHKFDVNVAEVEAIKANFSGISRKYGSQVGERQVT